MKTKIIYLFFLILPFIGFSQSENIISVTGFVNKEVKADSMRIVVKLTEIEGNEYQKIRPRELDEIMVELLANLKTVNLSKNDLVEVFPPISGYNSRNKSLNYYIYVTDDNKAKQIAGFSIKGFEASGFQYVYPDKVDFDFDKMSEQILSETRDKAEYLANVVNRKIGKVIKIEDVTTRRLNNYRNTNEPSIFFEYKMTVSYELLD